MEFRDAGDRTVVVEFGTTIDPALVAQVRGLDERIQTVLAEDPDGPLKGILETIPSFRSLAIVLDPLLTTPAIVVDAVAALSRSDSVAGVAASRQWTLPVCYGGEFGPDLDDVATRTGLDPQEIIALHHELIVAVYLLGFLPGFAFMGDTDTRLHLPRRSEPRLRVPAGSVGLALTLTAIYPWESPGGWNLIGHSPVRLFDADRTPAALLSPGDTVQFRPIQADEHAHLVESMAADQLDLSQFLVEPPA